MREESIPDMNGWLVALGAFIIIVGSGLGLAYSVQRDFARQLNGVRKPPTILGSAWWAALVGFLLSVGIVLVWSRYLTFARFEGEVHLLGLTWFVVGPSRMGYGAGAIGFVGILTVVAGMVWGFKT